ncbi:MAG: hypothetical protein RLZZ385_970 [Pseudomonadota bacterium]|jgi:hypothetical protein
MVTQKKMPVGKEQQFARTLRVSMGAQPGLYPIHPPALTSQRHATKRILMAKPNYSFEKKQKEIAKKKKKQEKAQKKLEKSTEVTAS